MLEDLSQAHDQTPLHPCLHGILLVQAVLEANQLLQQVGHTLVHVFTQHLAAVTETHGDGEIALAVSGSPHP